MGYRARLGQRQVRLPPTLLGRPARHRRHRSAGTRRQQLRQRRGRRIGALGRVYSSFPPLRFRNLYTRRRRRGLADQLRCYPPLLRTARTGDAGRRSAYYPWGHPHGYPYGPHPMGGVGNALIKGCTALNIPVSIGGPVAILSGSHGDRPHCIYRGFCIRAAR